MNLIANVVAGRQIDMSFRGNLEGAMLRLRLSAAVGTKCAVNPTTREGSSVGPAHVD